MTLKFRLPAVLLAAALTLAACGDSPSGADSQKLRMQQLSGSYVGFKYGAKKFTTIENGQTTDWLARGASLKIDLAADGTTTGRLLVPGGDEDGSDLDASMVGNWTLKGDTVRFQQNADTFVTDMPFLVQGGRLVGSSTFGGIDVDVTLSRD
jgi:hypothetical protein